jgi:hypothetical protein
MKSHLRKHLWFSRMVFALVMGLLFLPTRCANTSMSATPSASSPSALSSSPIAVLITGDFSVWPDPTSSAEVYKPR